MTGNKETKFKFKKGKEYNINVDVVILDSWGDEWEWNKVYTGIHPEYGCYEFIDAYGHESSLFDDEIISYNEPVSATEMFQMHTNYMNFYRKGPFQDLRYAQELRQKIVNTLKERRYVIHGAGKFEPFDYKLMYAIRNDIDSGLYQFEVGSTYTLQNGESITIIARDNYRVLGSDNIWRYDTCNEQYRLNLRHGLCVNTSWEFLDGRNIINAELGNRFELIQEFKAEYGYSDPDIKLIGNTTRINEVYDDYFKFLKSKKLKNVNPYFDLYI